MEEHNQLAKNLRVYKASRSLTMKELSRQLDVPETTLRNIMKDGNTTLHTAIRISKRLGIGLDLLVNDETFSDKLFILNQIQIAGSRLSHIPQNKKDKVSELIAEIWEVMSE